MMADDAPSMDATDSDALRRELAAVIPCYNAGDRVHPVVDRVCKELDHVVVVDDGSTDGAPQRLDTDPIRLITFAQNRGKGHALLAGFAAAIEEPKVTGVAVLDADGQHDPRTLPELYRAFRTEQADLVIGTRRIDPAHMPWKSRFGNTMTVAITAAILGRRIDDTQSGYRIHSRRFVEAILASVTGGRYETEMEILVKAIREGYRIVSVPIATIYEPGNRSSHFHALRDSFLVYKRLFSAAFRGSASK